MTLIKYLAYFVLFLFFSKESLVLEALNHNEYKAVSNKSENIKYIFTLWYVDKDVNRRPQTES